MNLEKLGTFIHNKREEAGIPLAKAAQKAEIGRSTLWILEQGKNPKTGKPSRPSKDILERLAVVLHMSQAETEEVLSLADYKVSTQPAQISNQVSLALQTGATQQHSPSPATTITEINGTVYLANNGYLQAFDAKTGKRLWSSSTEVPPLEPAYDFLSGRVEQSRSSTPSNTVDLDEYYIQKTAGANIREIAIEITRPDAKASEPQASKERKDTATQKRKPILTGENQDYTASAEKPEGLLFALLGIGGYENQDVLKKLREQEIGIGISKKCTTRSPRKGEKQGDPYVFLPRKEFDALKDAHKLLTYGLHPDRPDWYGHLAEPIMEQLRAGQDVIMEAGPEEAVMLRQVKPDTIFILLNLIDSGDSIQTTTAEYQQWKNRFQGLEFNHTITYDRSLVPEAANEAAHALRAIILAKRKKARETIGRRRVYHPKTPPQTIP